MIYKSEIAIIHIRNIYKNVTGIIYIIFVHDILKSP